MSPSWHGQNFQFLSYIPNLVLEPFLDLKLFVCWLFNFRFGLRSWFADIWAWVCTDFHFGKIFHFFGSGPIYRPQMLWSSVENFFWNFTHLCVCYVFILRIFVKKNVFLDIVWNYMFILNFIHHTTLLMYHLGLVVSMKLSTGRWARYYIKSHSFSSWRWWFIYIHFCMIFSSWHINDDVYWSFKLIVYKQYKEERINGLYS